jgi:hypothetical protein
MSGQPKHSRRRAVRAWTWAGLVVVPALAIVALGSGLLPTMLGSQSARAPSGLLLSETRLLTNDGNDLAGLGAATAYKAGEARSMDQFRDTWQNTVRRPPSPRR